MKRLLIGLLFGSLLAGCGERPQASGGKKADAKASSGAEGGYVAAGWKVGDQASWEQQIKNRAQSQNEYSRSTQ